MNQADIFYHTDVMLHEYFDDNLDVVTDQFDSSKLMRKQYSLSYYDFQQQK